MKINVILLFVIGYIAVNCEMQEYTTVPIVNAYPCKGYDDITVSYDPEDVDKANEYNVFINKSFTVKEKITLKLNSDGAVLLYDANTGKVSGEDSKTFVIEFAKDNVGVTFNVKGDTQTHIPYIISLVINSKEYCKQPIQGFLDNVLLRYKESAERVSREPKECGRRKVGNAGLEDVGVSSKPGDWPWHASIYQHLDTERKYTCGGTLISKEFVLTAAQCTSINGVSVSPDTLSVSLGKYNLIGVDKNTQEKQVHKIINHEKFDYQHLKNDIALLKLKSAVTFTSYVQPACLWYKKAMEKLPNDQIVGAIVGWGFDDQVSFSPHLQQVKMATVPRGTCLKNQPSFYSEALNSNKFCAGYSNAGVSSVFPFQFASDNLKSVFGTEFLYTANEKYESTVCNGDAGTSFQVFVPDNSKSTTPNASGAWYIKGIISLIVTRPGALICDPDHYIIFTDVEKYRIWIDLHVSSN